MMTDELKNKIITALEIYIRDNNLNQDDIVVHSGVNARYLIEMRRGNYSLKTRDKEVLIADKYFKRIADLISYQTEKQYWQTQATPQLKEILANLQEAKDHGIVAVLIGETGSGKTFSLELFKSKYRSEVFSIKVGSSDNLTDIVDKMMTELRLTSERKTKSAKLRQIANYMKMLSENGFDPLFAFDESEYMKQPALCSFKELVDYLNKWCSLVLLGTSQLTENIDKLRKKNKAGIPQLYRRIKFRIRHLSPIDRRFRIFLKEMDKETAKWLQDNCDNYGELHDVMVAVLREADRTGKPMNLEFLKIVLGQQ
ncbi:AAA family ATPase [Sphingobacterium spiritivorum]